MKPRLVRSLPVVPEVNTTGWKRWMRNMMCLHKHGFVKVISVQPVKCTSTLKWLTVTLQCIKFYRWEKYRVRATLGVISPVTFWVLHCPSLTLSTVPRLVNSVQNRPVVVKCCLFRHCTYQTTFTHMNISWHRRSIVMNRSLFPSAHVHFYILFIVANIADESTLNAR